MLEEPDFIVGFPQPAKWMINLGKELFKNELLQNEASTSFGKTRSIFFNKLNEDKEIVKYYRLVYDHSYENSERLLLKDISGFGDDSEVLVYEKELYKYILDKDEFTKALENISKEIINKVFEEIKNEETI